MSQKYTDARYPEKVNDFIDNEGQISEAGQAVVTESVNKSIESGDIPLPASGTKWYKHTVTVAYDVYNPDKTEKKGSSTSKLVFYSLNNIALDADDISNAGDYIGLGEITINHYSPSYMSFNVFSWNGFSCSLYNIGIFSSWSCDIKTQLLAPAHRAVLRNEGSPRIYLYDNSEKVYVGWITEVTDTITEL